MPTAVAAVALHNRRGHGLGRRAIPSEVALAHANVAPAVVLALAFAFSTQRVEVILRGRFFLLLLLPVLAVVGVVHAQRAVPLPDLDLKRAELDLVPPVNVFARGLVHADVCFPHVKPVLAGKQLGADIHAGEEDVAQLVRLGLLADGILDSDTFCQIKTRKA